MSDNGVKDKHGGTRRAHCTVNAEVTTEKCEGGTVDGKPAPESEDWWTKHSRRHVASSFFKHFPAVHFPSTQACFSGSLSTSHHADLFWRADS